MASYTEHYGLHQWEPNDDFLRTDFNTDLGKIDTALGGKCEVVAGTYTGTGVNTEKNTINLGFKPKFVILGSANFEYVPTHGVSSNCNVIYPDVTCEGATGWERGTQRIVEDGFEVSGVPNTEATVFQYLAFR